VGNKPAPFDWLKASAAVRDTPMPTRCKVVLWALVSRADKRGDSFASLSTLAADTGLSRRHVSSVLTRLHGLGVAVTVSHERGGKKVRRLLWRRIQGTQFTSEQVAPVNTVHRGSEHSAPGVVNTVHRGSEHSAPEGIHEEIQTKVSSEGIAASPAPPTSSAPAKPAPPKWAQTAARGRDCTAAELLAGCAAIQEATGARSRSDHGISPTAARPILSLWRALERPPWAEFAAQAQLVVEAARKCPDPLFARNLRAEGWADGRDRSRSLPSVLRHERWDERLAAAEAWRDGGKSEQPRPRAAAGGAPGGGWMGQMQDALREMRAEKAQQWEVIDGGAND